MGHSQAPRNTTNFFSQPPHAQETSKEPSFLYLKMVLLDLPQSSCASWYSKLFKLIHERILRQCVHASRKRGWMILVFACYAAVGWCISGAHAFHPMIFRFPLEKLAQHMGIFENRSDEHQTQGENRNFPRNLIQGRLSVLCAKTIFSRVGKAVVQMSVTRLRLRRVTSAAGDFVQGKLLQYRIFQFLLQTTPSNFLESCAGRVLSLSVFSQN